MVAAGSAAAYAVGDRIDPGAAALGKSADIAAPRGIPDICNWAALDVEASHANRLDPDSIHAAQVGPRCRRACSDDAHAVREDGRGDADFAPCVELVAPEGVNWP